MIKLTKRLSTVRVRFPADCRDLMEKWAVDTLDGRQIGNDILNMKDRTIERTYSFNSSKAADDFVHGLWVNVAMNINVLHMNV